MSTLSLATLAAALSLASEVPERGRQYTLSRDWFLPEAGEHELEARTFWDLRNGDFREQLEYEYGVTDWFAIEPGVEFRHHEGTDFEAEALELELRFHFLEFGYDRFLPGLNVEYEHALEDDEDDNVEVRGSLSWYGARGQDFTVNVAYEVSVEDSSDDESEVTFGFLRPWTLFTEGQEPEHMPARFGFEAVYDLEEDHAGLGPLTVIRASESLNLALAVIFGLDERDENHDELRLVLEWEF